MIPNFTSHIDMINYFKTLEGSDFDRLLRDEFNFDPPATAPLYQREYLFKYLVQGSVFQNKTGDDLVKYAVERTENLVKIQPHLKLKGEVVVPTVKVVTTGTNTKTKQRSGKIVGSFGEIRFLAHRGVWVGFGQNGKVCVTKKTEEGIKAFFAKN